MNILVCIKQVPDLESTLAIDPDAKWILEDDTLKFRINHFDAFALEEAIRIKESFPDVTIDALSVGPARVDNVLKHAISVGVHDGIHILTEEGGYMPPHMTATLIAEYAASKSYDLILAGVMAEDDMLYQVGPMTAALLDIPCATSVVKEQLYPENRTIAVDCEMEGGMTEQVELTLPALLTIQSGINHPRYPSLSNVLRANSQERILIHTDTAEAPGQREKVLSLALPEKSSKGVMLDGTPEEKAEMLLKIFHEKSFLK